MNNPFFELCAENLAAAWAAEQGGVDRVELCAGLSIGGVTPHFDLVTAATETLSIPVHVLIRPRVGDFVFSTHEFEQMRGEIEQARAAGAAGVAIGVLLRDGRVDVDRSRELTEQAHPMKVTFHRAFDETPDLDEALDAVIQSGADCLLTSGGKPDALSGASAIARLCGQAGERLDIMAGGGLQLSNLVEVLRQTGISYLHGSLIRKHAARREESRYPQGSEHLTVSDPVTLGDDVREAVRLLRNEYARRKFPEQMGC